MFYKINKILLSGILVLVSYCVTTSCTKTAVEFGTQDPFGDPNITIIDTFNLSVSTLQVDSFGTVNNYMVAGFHHDPKLGDIEAKSFFQIDAPVANLHDVKNCVFDSLVFSTKLTSGFMGDTLAPYTLNINEITQAMNTPYLPSGYNINSVTYNSTPLVSKTFYLRPTRQDSISIRMPDDFGQNIFRMLKAQPDTITDNTKFQDFFKGICLSSGVNNNSMYYFRKADSTTMQLFYTIHGATPVSHVVRFTVSSSDLHYNSFSYNKSGTALTGFVPKTRQVIPSEQTNNVAYMHFNSGLFPRINLGNLLTIKELHPYVQVLRATLTISPVIGTYGIGTFYSLPPSVELRQIDDNNFTTGPALTYSNGSVNQTQEGNLYIDGLFGLTTAYNYDVTAFVNSVIAEGVFSRRALLMYPLAANSISNDQRLLITNSNTSAKNPIKLKLYVLGL